MSYPRVGHQPIPMRRVWDGWYVPAANEGDARPGLRQRGDFFWRWQDQTATRGRLLVVALPCLPAVSYENKVDPWVHTWWTLDMPNRFGDQWTWDGDEDKPTLTPSLGVGGYWHGWIRAGQLVEV